MRMGRWMVVSALAGALAVGACGGDDFEAGDTSIEDMEGGTPAGAIPAPEASTANQAAAGMPLDSAAGDSVRVDSARADSVTPELGR
jgi:hypothetical protein